MYSSIIEIFPKSEKMPGIHPQTPHFFRIFRIVFTDIINKSDCFLKLFQTGYEMGQLRMFYLWHGSI